MKSSGVVMLHDVNAMSKILALDKIGVNNFDSEIKTRMLAFVSENFDID
jgi:hypothetical protein